MSTRTASTKAKGAAVRGTKGPVDAHRKAQRTRAEVNAACEKVLDLMHQGRSTTSACEEVKLSWRVFVDWAERDDSNAQRYASARARLLERMAEEIHQIANTPVEGETTVVKADGGVEVKRGDMIEHRRLQIDARKWLLSKLMPQKYGERQQIDHNLTDSTAAVLLAARKRSGIDKP